MSDEVAQEPVVGPITEDQPPLVEQCPEQPERPEAPAENENGEESVEDALTRTARELLTTQQHRQFLADRLAIITERLLGHQLAVGTIRAAQVVPLLNRELSDVNATLEQISQAVQ